MVFALQRFKIRCLITSEKFKTRQILTVITKKILPVVK